ncbi:MAG TPA: fused MFS/spermidine synthase, partial [Candidatus Saccharimonadales bacterium]|nr:fused MFS/spermidine synthase [Candidatus Saccharimonadales bacterium]
MKKITGRFGALESVAFASGFSLMAFELIGARMLAPAIGSSTYVWTSVIGVIIAALSAGYFLGGKLADLRGRPGDIALLCLTITIGMGAMLLLFDSTMAWIVQTQSDLRFKGVIASLLLFAPTSLLIGMLSPYLVKLKITSLLSSGQSVAGLSAFESIGGIVGTFVTGFIVFSYIGAREALVV